MSASGAWRGLLRVIAGRRLPTTRGVLRLDGLRQGATIRRDRYGVPYIEAASDVDAWFAIGFCQGQDRTFQLELLLRAIRGTLAALLGADLLPVDRLSRRVGLGRAARAQLEIVDADVREMLEAYARGVTAGATTGRRRRPHEFLLLGAAPTPWAAHDALGLMKLQSFLLAANWDAELTRYLMWRDDGEAALRSLDFSVPEWLSADTPRSAGRAADGLAEELARMRHVLHPGGGSNAWAAAGARTRTGGTLLANDPHLASTLPSHWYLAHVATPAWSAAGATFVGAPGFAAGHNAHGAWGVTVSCTDASDLFLERVNADGVTVQGRDGPEACAVVDEVIEVRGGEAVTERVLVTPRGPVISPALDADVEALSLRATWLEPRPVRGLLLAHRSVDFDSFREAFRQWPGLGLSVVYAGRDGTVGQQVVGDIPRRREGHGWLPQLAWAASSGWYDAHVPFDDNPYRRDPSEGFVATANNRPAAAAEAPFLTVDFVDGYRHARLRERLAAADDWDVDAFAALQLDQASLPWRDMRDAVLGVATTGDAHVGQTLLAAWDGEVSASAPAAAVFQLLVADLARRLVEAAAPKTARHALGQGFSVFAPHTVFVLQHTMLVARHLRGPLGAGDEDRIAAALGSAVHQLQGRCGPRPEDWAWGRVRRLTLRHPLGKRWPLGHVYDLGPAPWGGDAHTVSQASVDPRDPLGSPGVIASLRMVVDTADPRRNRYVLPGGQSGNPLSPHYRDQFDLWVRGEALALAWGAADIDAAAVERLALEPVQEVSP